MSQDFKGTPTSELVGIHNALADKPIKAWKGKRDDLIDRVHKLQAGVEKPKATKASSVSKVKSAAPKTAEKATAKVTKSEATGNGPSADTIRAAALKWLCHVEYYENRDEKVGLSNVVDAKHPKARSVGLPYLEIVERIRTEFPGCETSVACLRWYSVKVRAEEFGYEGYRLCQRRPRAKPAGN